MDIDTLVMTAAVHLGVRAGEAETLTGPIPGSRLTVIEFGSSRDAALFAAACMGDGVPALAHDTSVVVLHG